MSNPVSWFEIYVDDAERAKSFYASVFKVEFEDVVDPTGSGMEMFMFPADFEKYGASGALIKTKDMPAGGNSTRVYFACEDCAVEESRIEAAGGTVQQSKTSLGEFGFYVTAVDTEGNMFGLHSDN